MDLRKVGFHAHNNKTRFSPSHEVSGVSSHVLFSEFPGTETLYSSMRNTMIKQKQFHECGIYYSSPWTILVKMGNLPRWIMRQCFVHSFQKVSGYRFISINQYSQLYSLASLFCVRRRRDRHSCHAATQLNILSKLPINNRIAGMLGGGKVWRPRNHQRFTKLKPSRLVVTINNLLADLFVRQNFRQNQSLYPSTFAKLFRYSQLAIQQ